jgi:hypothetical protein
MEEECASKKKTKEPAKRANHKRYKMKGTQVLASEEESSKERKFP